MDIPLAYFILMALAMGLVLLPQFRFVDNHASSSGHYAALDGLRGFAALSVFVHHLVIYYYYIDTGLWSITNSRFYALLGPVGVSLFFMITGFLFWGKMLRTRGRPDWRSLYIRRLFRIGPMYLFVVLVMLFIVFAKTDFQLYEPLSVVMWSVFQWLALGIIDTQPDVNTYKATHVLAGVTWTIYYEWIFYASLVLSAFFSRGKWHMLFITVGIVLSLLGKVLLDLHVSGLALLFLCGMMAASLLHENFQLRISQRLLSILAISCISILLITSSNGYGTLTSLMLALFFYLVVSGANLFGLLTCLPAVRLGNISYSIYLMQGLVLTAIFAIPAVREFAMTSSLSYWTIGLLCLYTLIICAALGYVFIEKPGIAIGNCLLQRKTETVAVQGPLQNRGTGSLTANDLAARKQECLGFGHLFFQRPRSGH